MIIRTEVTVTSTVELEPGQVFDAEVTSAYSGVPRRVRVDRVELTVRGVGEDTETIRWAVAGYIYRTDGELGTARYRTHAIVDDVAVVPQPLDRKSVV